MEKDKEYQTTITPTAREMGSSAPRSGDGGAAEGSPSHSSTTEQTGCALLPLIEVLSRDMCWPDRSNQWQLSEWFKAQRWCNRRQGGLARLPWPCPSYLGKCTQHTTQAASGPPSPLRGEGGWGDVKSELEAMMIADVQTCHWVRLPQWHEPALQQACSGPLTSREQSLSTALQPPAARGPRTAGDTWT